MILQNKDAKIVLLGELSVTISLFARKSIQESSFQAISKWMYKSQSVLYLSL